MGERNNRIQQFGRLVGEGFQDVINDALGERIYEALAGAVTAAGVNTLDAAFQTPQRTYSSGPIEVSAKRFKTASIRYTIRPNYGRFLLHRRPYSSRRWRGRKQRKTR